MSIKHDDFVSVKQLVLNNHDDDDSPPDSPTNMSHTNSTESYMYLSSHDHTEPSISRLVGAEDDDDDEEITSDQLHLLLEKARQLTGTQQQQQQATGNPPAKANTDFKEHVSSTPLPNFNFRPKLNLLQRNKAFQNSPLSQSTPLIPQITNQNQKDGVIFHRQESNLGSRLDEEAKKDDSQSIASSKSTRHGVESKQSKEEDITGYISPETTPPTSNGIKTVGSPLKEEDDNTTDADELENLKKFLSKSKIGSQLLENFEMGKTASPSSSSAILHHFSRSITSTPQKPSFQESMENEENPLTLNDLVEEIDYLNAKIQESEKMVRNLKEEINEVKETSKAKEEHLYKDCNEKDNKIDELESKLLSMSGNKQVENFLEAIIGEERNAINEESLRLNHKQNLYNDLKLSQIDGLTFIELQNLLKEISITLQTEYQQLQHVIPVITKFFREDYLRIILFINEVHDTLYPRTRLRLPEIYKLNWISSKHSFEGVHDQNSVENFDKCLDQMLNILKVLKERI